MAWAKNGTPNTLTGTADDIDITDLTAKKFNFFISHQLQSGATSCYLKFNGDSSSVYADRYSINGGSDATDTNLFIARWYNDSTDTTDRFSICYLYSILGEEKLGISFTCEQISTGAGTAPERIELVLKYVPSPDANVTQINLDNAGAGDWATGSNLSALGTD